MTTNGSTARGDLPGLDALIAVCDHLGLHHTPATRQRSTSNAVYVLDKESVVVRLAPDTPIRRVRAETAIAVTRWISTQSDVIALTPSPIPQPVIAGGVVATVWPYRPSAPAALTELATPLRHLHQLPDPPFAVPQFQPLARLYEALARDHARPHPVLTHASHEWLEAQANRLVDACQHTEWPLGWGVVHCDAHSGNLVRDNGVPVLIDWDNACNGPREMDLVAGLPDHFHEPAQARSAFLAAYGYDLTTYDAWRLVRDLAELKSLASYIRRAPSHPDVAEELRIRLGSLQTRDRTITWRSVPSSL